MLGKHRVDMWPLVGVTPERQKKFYFTKPWLESDYVLLSLDAHPIRTANDAAGELMAHARLRMTAVVARKCLPTSNVIVKLRRPDAVEAVCKGEAQGALVEGRVLDSLMLSRPAAAKPLTSTSPLSPVPLQRLPSSPFRK